MADYWYPAGVNKYKYDDELYMWIMEQHDQIPLPRDRREVTLTVPVKWLHDVILADRTRYDAQRNAEHLSYLVARLEEAEKNGGFPPVRQILTERFRP